MELATTEEIIDEARNGRMFILIDDEDRENEGDLVIPAQLATPEAINFMARFGRGLICLALDAERVRRLGLPLMAQQNGTRHQTAFTVSIEAREGVTTGISAPDRARTVAAAIDETAGPEAITSPGHVFPLVARDGGVMVRAGHTEAAVDVARLAGLNPSGVICEIMNEDGTMARLKDLHLFAERHGLKIGTIRDLITYRRQRERLVRCVKTSSFTSQYGGEWVVKTFAGVICDGEYLVLQKGTIEPGRPAYARVHNLSLMGDVLGDQRPSTAPLHAAMQEIGRLGNGAIVLIPEDRREGMRNPVGIRSGDPEIPLRDYGIGAQILRELGASEIILLTNHDRAIVGIEGHGLRIIRTQPVDTRPQSHMVDASASARSIYHAEVVS